MSFEGLRGFSSLGDADRVNMLNNEYVGILFPSRSYEQLMVRKAQIGTLTTRI